MSVLDMRSAQPNYRCSGTLFEAQTQLSKLELRHIRCEVVTACAAHLSVDLCKLRVLVGEGSNLRRAHKSEVQRVEEQDDVLSLHTCRCPSEPRNACDTLSIFKQKHRPGELD